MVHAAVLMPMMIKMFHRESRIQIFEARFEPDDFTAPDEAVQDPPETPLGIDAETPSTLTWIGYEEYEEHIAALAEMDQAAFTDDPASARPQPPTPTPTPPVVEPLEQAVAVTESTETPEVIEETPPAPIDPENLQALRNVMDALGQLLTDQSPDETAEPQQTVAEATDPAAAPETASASPATESTEAKPAEAEPTPPEEPAPVVPVTSGEPTPGEEADKESDPTSVIEAKPEIWKTGKPLASPGLEIKTRKPELTVLQRITMAARNPLCLIAFNAKGKPTRVDFLEGSGSKEFDSAISASLYRWRASGKRLEELKKGQTADVKIRIIVRDR